MAKTCVLCGNEHEGKGYCKKHYRSFLRYGDPLYVEKQREERKRLQNSPKPTRTRLSREGTCSVEGCNEAIKSKRLCEKHYARQLRNGTLEVKNIPPFSIPTCLAVGCDRPYKTSGYCDTHYTNFRRTGSPHLPKVIKYCGVKGCMNIHQAKGLCMHHYHEWEKKLSENSLSYQLELHHQEEE